MTNLDGGTGEPTNLKPPAIAMWIHRNYNILYTVNLQVEKSLG